MKASRTRHTGLALLPALVLVLGLLLAACGGGEEAQGGGRERPSREAAPADNPLAADSPIEEDGVSSAGAGGASAAGSSAAPDEDPFGGAEEPVDPETLPQAGGNWQGTLTPEGGTEASLRLELEQEVDRLAGRGLLVADERGPIALEPLEGTVDDTGAVEILFDNPEQNQSTTFVGTLEADTIAGEMTLTGTDSAGVAFEERATFFLNRTTAGG